MIGGGGGGGKKKNHIPLYYVLFKADAWSYVTYVVPIYVDV